MNKEQKTFEEFQKEHSWLMSDSFLKRSFAIYGYAIIPVLILYGAIALLAGLAVMFE